MVFDFLSEGGTVYEGGKRAFFQRGRVLRDVNICMWRRSV